MVGEVGGIFLGVSEMKLGLIFTPLTIIALFVIGYLKFDASGKQKVAIKLSRGGFVE